MTPIVVWGSSRGACSWCAQPVAAGRKTCSSTHKARAKEKRRQVEANASACPTPKAGKYLTEAAARAANLLPELAITHCQPGCLAWHALKSCPTPGKVRYPDSFHAHQAQPGAKNAGMAVYKCSCGSWHWGHTEKRRTTIGRALALGSARSRRVRP